MYVLNFAVLVATPYTFFDLRNWRLSHMYFLNVALQGAVPYALLKFALLATDAYYTFGL